jgi:DNA-binding Lrp family transcriptional regulator
MVENVDRVRALPGIEHAETLLVTRIYVGRMWNSGSDDQQWPSTPERTIDAVDREIIRTLRADGRMSYTHLAAIIGLTVPAARRRVLRLVADGVMRFVTQLNDRSISRAEASIDLTVAGRARAAVIDSLTTRRSIRYVIEQTGHHDLACYVVTDSIASLAAEIASITADLRVLDAHAEPYVILRDETSWTR